MDQNEQTPQETSTPPTSPTPAPAPPNPERRKGAGVSARASGARWYPKPPALPVRMVMLCLRPETWAEMARYPTRFTIVPLLLAIVIASVAAGIGEAVRVGDAVATFAAGYDAKYPALVLDSDGVLSAKGEMKEPVTFEYASSNGSVVRVVADPQGLVKAGTLKGPTILLTAKEAKVYQGDGEEPSSVMPLTRFLWAAIPEKGKTGELNGTVLKEEAEGFAMGGGMMVMVAKGAGNIVWTGMALFLIAPVVTLAAAGIKFGDGPDRRLILPARASYRITGSVLVPVLIVEGVLHGVGHAMAGVLGGEGAWLFCFFGATALAAWAGLMARRMYGPKEPVRAGRGK